LITIDDLNRVDVKGMYKIYDIWPILARNAFESKIKPIDFEGIEHIVFAGMGGSGTIGDIFASILSKSKIHVNVVKGYHLPSTVNDNTLVVCISVSGNTSETLSIQKSAHLLNCKLICFSSGGELLEFSKKNNIAYRIIPENHSPRASFTTYLYSILKILYNFLGIKYSDVLESIVELERLHEKINSSNLSHNNTALDLAEWLFGIPMIYHPYGLRSSCIRFKNSLNENAKMHVFTEDVIEECHNGIVAWEKSSNVQPILIEGHDDHIKTKERWKILETFFQQNNIGYKKIVSIEGNIISKLITLIYLFDYSSIYKSILDGTDPSPVDSIAFVKSKL